MRYWILLVSVLAAACTNGDNAHGTSLVTTSTEPPGANCAAGGIAIHTGVDRNDDGTLDPDEITATSYVCTPANSPQALVDVVEEPAGPHCANGGEQIRSGVDTNGNGVLDANEVTQVSYVCSGADGSGATDELVTVVVEPQGAHCANGGQAIETGADVNHDGMLEASEVTSTSYVCSGADGPQPLLRIDDEPAGANCVAGGRAIHVGVDTNDDSILEDSEIESTTYLCNAANPTTICGSFTVENSMDASVLIGVQHITGNLVIDATGLDSIDLSSLVSVGGSISVPHFSGTELDLPLLESVGGLFEVTPQMTSMVLDSLVTSGGLSLNTAAVTLPKLVSAPAGVTLGGMTSDVSLPVFTTEGQFSVTESDHAAHVVSVPALVHGKNLEMYYATLDAPSLQVGDGVYLFYVSNVHVPALASATIIEIFWSSLTSFPFEQLTSPFSLSMVANAHPIPVASTLSSLESLDIWQQPTALDLPNVSSLRNLSIQDSYILSIDLGALKSVTTLDLEQTSLTTLPFPSLTSTYEVTIGNNSHLSQCDAEAFAASTGAMASTITNNGPC